MADQVEEQQDQAHAPARDTTAVEDIPEEYRVAYQPPPPSAEVVERARQAVKALEPYGVGRDDVKVETKWWGFQIVLTPAAVDVLETIREFIAEIVAEALTPVIGELVKLYVTVQAAVIRRIANGGSVRLVSPWLSPAMLIPLPYKEPDKRLYWRVFEPASGWNKQEMFVGQATSENPALALLNGRTYCVYRAAHNSAIYWTSCDPDGGGWGNTDTISSWSTPSSPALTVFNGKLFCMHRGSGNRLHYATSDGRTWSAASDLGNWPTSAGPALAVYNNQLFCAMRGTNGRLYLTKTGGSSWDGFPEMDHLDNEPALAVYNNRLYCVFRGNDKKLLHISYGDGGWRGHGQILNHQTSDGPALEAFAGRLYCVFKAGHNDEQFMASLGPDGWRNHGLTEARSAQGPGLLAGRDRNGTRDQLLCVYRGA